MSTGKRSYAAFSADARGQGEARSGKAATGHQAFKKRKAGFRNDAKPDNLNWLKKRARTIERKFRADQNLPANVANDLERELAHHKQKISEVEDGKRKSKMISKYHMIRFFERKKADRLAKQIERRISENEDQDQLAKLRDDLHVAQVDSLYAKFFPFREPYVSLYPIKGKDKDEDTSSAARALRAERPAMWNVIERASRKGMSALVEIRERNPTSSTRSKPLENEEDEPATRTKRTKTQRSTNAKVERTPSNSHEKGQTAQKKTSSADPEQSDSDGGFFEES